MPTWVTQSGFRSGLNISEYKGHFRPVPWFRRLYFDGFLSGRLEFGFNVFDFHRDHPLDLENFTESEPTRLARITLETKVIVKSIDGSLEETTLSNSTKALSISYLTASTTKAGLFKFPPSDTFRKAFDIGEPFVHIRVPSHRPVREDNDRYYINADGKLPLFITSSGGQSSRGNVLIQIAEEYTHNEEPFERVVRVLFAHLNSLIFSYSRLERLGSDLQAGSSHELFRAAVERMLTRLEKLSQDENGKWDAEFSKGLKLFARAYAGRIDDLTARLEELSAELDKPTVLESVGAYFKRLHDLIVRTGIEKTIDMGSYGGGAL